MNLSLEGKNALVCGSSKGIGKAIAHELAALGASVTLLARTVELLEMVLSELPRIHSMQDHDYLAADMEDVAEVRKKVHLLTANKTYHILINNTGGPQAGPLLDFSSESIESAFKKLFLVNHELVRLVVPGMKEEAYGRIINITSVAVKEPVADLGISNSIRAAVSNWSKTLANELGQYNITSNNVLPGYTATERLEQLFAFRAKTLEVTKESLEGKAIQDIPMQRFGKPEEIAAVVAFLASPAASYINGVNIPVDGGRTKGL